MVLIADMAADPGGAVAGRGIEIPPRGVRPAVMHIGRQRHRAASVQRRASTSTSYCVSSGPTLA